MTRTKKNESLYFFSLVNEPYVRLLGKICPIDEPYEALLAACPCILRSCGIAWGSFCHPPSRAAVVLSPCAACDMNACMHALIPSWYGRCFRSTSACPALSGRRTRFDHEWKRGDSLATATPCAETSLGPSCRSSYVRSWCAKEVSRLAVHARVKVILPYCTSTKKTKRRAG